MNVKAFSLPTPVLLIPTHTLFYNLIGIHKMITKTYLQWKSFKGGDWLPLYQVQIYLGAY